MFYCTVALLPMTIKTEFVCNCFGIISKFYCTVTTIPVSNTSKVQVRDDCKKAGSTVIPSSSVDRHSFGDIQIVFCISENNF